MPQQTSPFVESKYGWNFGEALWNTGADENWLKFGFLHDNNVDGVVASLPAVVNGEAYFLTTDNRFYFAVNSTWYSSPCPKWFIFKVRSTGMFWQFDGASAVEINNPQQANAALEAIQDVINTLGTAAFVSLESLATQAELDVAVADAAAYTDDLRSDLASTSPGMGAELVGFKQAGTGAAARTVDAKLKDVVSVKDFGALGDGTSHPLSEQFSTLAEAQVRYPHVASLSDEIDWAAIQAAVNSGFSVVEVNVGIFVCNKTITASNRDISLIGSGEMHSEIRFTSDVTYGVNIEQTGAYISSISGIHLSTDRLNTGTALRISYAGYVGTYERNRRLVLVEYNRVAGVDYFNHGWKNGIILDECMTPLVQHNFVVGRRDLAAPAGATRWWPWTEDGILYTSTTDLSPTDPIFFNNDIRYCMSGFRNLGVLEGVRYVDCVVVACKNGILDDRREIVGADTIDPWLRVTGCHFNVSAFGVKSIYCFQGFISECLIYQFVFVDEDFIGISTETGNNWKINDNHITGNASSTFTVKGIRLQQNNRSVVSFNEIEFVDVGIEASGTNGMVRTRFFMNRCLDPSGNELPSVTYVDGINSYENPTFNPVGIIFEGSNGGFVNIASDSFSDLLTVNLDSYPEGATFRFNTQCRVLKGGTSGVTKVYVEKSSGTASVAYMATSSELGVQLPQHTASTNWLSNFSGIVKKTTSGTLTLKVAVSSLTSNASVSAGDGQCVVERIV